MFQVSLSTQNKNEKSYHVTAWYLQPAGMLTGFFCPRLNARVPFEGVIS